MVNQITNSLIIIIIMDNSFGTYLRNSLRMEESVFD